MILMTVAADSDKISELKTLLNRYGISLVHYRNPIKAMDNILESDPKIILYNLQDYPRHWKIMVKFLREDSERDQSIFILYSDEKPDLEEANKALFLGVNGIVSEKRTPQELCQSIVDIYMRYGALNHNENAPFLVNNPESPLGFVFRHPLKKNLVTGILLKMNEVSGVFKPDFRHEISDLSPGDELHFCTLRLDKELITVNAVVTQNTGQLFINLQFTNAKDKELLMTTLQKS